jgi:hypothetical protein
MFQTLEHKIEGVRRRDNRTLVSVGRMDFHYKGAVAAMQR